MASLIRLLQMLGSARNARGVIESAKGSVSQVKATANELQAASFQRSWERAHAGHVSSQYDMGEYYYEGRGVEKDWAAAFAWFLKAAENGHGKSQLNVGIMLSVGRGTEKDQAAGCRWLEKAVESGVAGAEDLLTKARSRLKGDTSSQTGESQG